VRRAVARRRPGAPNGCELELSQGRKVGGDIAEGVDTVGRFDAVTAGPAREAREVFGHVVEFPSAVAVLETCQHAGDLAR
jgi:hypothetical protein